MAKPATAHVFCYYACYKLIIQMIYCLNSCAGGFKHSASSAKCSYQKRLNSYGTNRYVSIVNTTIWAL